MAAISGFAGRVTSGSSNLPATRWQLMWKVDTIDVTCFEAQGGPSRGSGTLDNSTGWLVPNTGNPIFAGLFSNQGELGAAGLATPASNWAAGMTEMEASIDCYWDTNVSPFSAGAPLLVPGLVVSVTLQIDRSQGNTKAFGPFPVLIGDVSMDTEVRGVVKYSFSGKVAGINKQGTIVPTA